MSECVRQKVGKHRTPHVVILILAAFVLAGCTQPQPNVTAPADDGTTQTEDDRAARIEAACPLEQPSDNRTVVLRVVPHLREIDKNRSDGKMPPYEEGWALLDRQQGGGYEENRSLEPPGCAVFRMQVDEPESILAVVRVPLSSACGYQGGASVDLVGGQAIEVEVEIGGVCE